MMFGRESEAEYFSVTHTTSIGMMRCVPQVCYKLAGDIRGAVEGMAKKGLARVYPEEVRFISGEPVPVKKPGGQTGAVSPAPLGKPPGGPARPVSTETGKGGKRRGREFE